MRFWGLRLRELDIIKADPKKLLAQGIRLGDLLINPATHAVRRGVEDIKLNAKEFSLLEYFMRHPNQVLTRELIESHIWSYDFICASNVVDVYVRRLRRKIDDPFTVKLLETVYGVGYRLRLPVGA